MLAGGVVKQKARLCNVMIIHIEVRNADIKGAPTLKAKSSKLKD